MFNAHRHYVNEKKKTLSVWMSHLRSVRNSRSQQPNSLSPLQSDWSVLGIDSTAANCTVTTLVCIS